MAHDNESRAPVAWGKLFFIGLMYMAQTFPAGFVSSFIPTLYRKQGLPLEQFWVFSLPLIPYWLRWAIAPVVDTYWYRPLGRRRSWIIPCTLAAVVAYASLAAFEPSQRVLWVIVTILFVKSMFTATQEVAIDAYVVDNVRPYERSASASLNVTFEAFGQMLALAGLGVVVEQFGWRVGAVSAALLMLLFLLPAMIRREPPVSDAVERRLAARKPGIAGAFEPLARFFKRRDTWVLVPLLLLGGLFTGALFPMLGPLLVDLGYSVSQIGMIVGIVLAGATVVGATLAHTLVRRLGAPRVLAGLAVFALPSIAPAAWMAMSGEPLGIPATIAVLFLPTVVVAIFYVVFVAFRLGLAAPTQAGTDYAAGAAISRLAQTGAAAAGGPIAAAIGWSGFFAVIGVIGALTTLAVWRNYGRLMSLVDERNRREVELGATSETSGAIQPAGQNA